MSSMHSEDLKNQVNQNGQHMPEWQPHPFDIHADSIDIIGSEFRS